MLTLQPVVLPADGVRLAAELAGPPAAAGVVVIARGTGSCRHDPGHRSLADRLHRVGLGTLLVDLLTDAEERDALAGRARPDGTLLADRLVAVAGWTVRQPLAGGRPLGLLGTAAAAGSALGAAARRPDLVRAVGVVPAGHPLPGAGTPAGPVLAVLGAGEDRPAAARVEVVDVAGPSVDLPDAVDAAAPVLAAWFPRALGA